jgi:hypothetical protein
MPKSSRLNFGHHSISQVIFIRMLKCHSNNGPKINRALSQPEWLVGEEDLSDTVSYSTVTLHLGDTRCSGPMDPEAAPDYDHKLDDSDQSILTAFSESPFASVRESSQLAQVST